jgi:tetratricopeptide (TPR) repeat protein
MKKAVVASLLMAASFAPLATTMHALGQAAAATDSSQVQMSAPEYKSYNDALTATTPAAKAAAFEAYLTAYPQSAVKADVLQQLMIAYSQVPQPDKAIDAADRLLQVEPNNLRALTFEVYLRKQSADALTDAAAKQAALDQAASFATKALAATKSKGMTDAEFNTLKTSVTPTFYSAIATDDLAKKDTADAITNLKLELHSVPVDQTTKPGPLLQDTYSLGIAYYQSTPPDYVNCTWYTSRAAAFAPDPYKTEFLKVANYCYKKYHGGSDGYDAVTAAVTTSLDPPAGFTIKAAPSPADIVKQVIASTPDLATLAVGDKEFILANGSPEDAAKVWDTIKGKTVEIPDVAVVSVADTAITVSVSDDAVQSKTADFTFNLKEAPKTAPAVGDKITLTGTYASYTPSPIMIVMSDAAIVPAKKAPVKKAPVHHATHK